MVNYLNLARSNNAYLLEWLKCTNVLSKCISAEDANIMLETLQKCSSQVLHQIISGSFLSHDLKKANSGATIALCLSFVSGNCPEDLVTLYSKGPQPKAVLVGLQAVKNTYRSKLDPAAFDLETFKKTLAGRTGWDPFGAWLRSSNIDGEGASIIIADTRFDDNSLVHYAPLLGDRVKNKTPHGMMVALAAASKEVQKQGIPAFAPGAWVHPISLDEKTTLNQSLINNIQIAIDRCKANNKPIPRVINLSCLLDSQVGLDHDGKSCPEKFIHQLTKILEENDMLFIISAGNDKKTLGVDSDRSNPYRIDIRSNLNKYPDLLKRMIIVCSVHASNRMLKPSAYSCAPGLLRHHSIAAFGNIYVDGVQSHGTSFAAPRVAAMCAVLAKYFNHLNMLEIKAILLASANKPKITKDAKVIIETSGHGVLWPERAWFYCVMYENNIAKSGGYINE